MGSAALLLAGGVAYVGRCLHADTAVLLSMCCWNVDGFHARATMRTASGHPEIPTPTNSCVLLLIGHLLRVAIVPDDGLGQSVPSYGRDTPDGGTTYLREKVLLQSASVTSASTAAP